MARTSICFDCKNACGGCSWSEVDPITKKPRFVPVPGWTAQKVCLNLGTAYGRKRIVENYYVTACPQFEPDHKKRRRKGRMIDDRH